MQDARSLLLRAGPLSDHVQLGALPLVSVQAAYHHAAHVPVRGVELRRGSHFDTAVHHCSHPHNLVSMSVSQPPSLQGKTCRAIG